MDNSTMSEAGVVAIYEQNPNKINWQDVSQNCILSDDFIREFKHFVDWGLISRFQTLSENFIEEFSNKVDWDWIFAKQTLSENFIITHWTKTDINNVVKGQVLSEDLIYSHRNEVDWDLISCCQTLSEPFIRAFKNQLNWTYIWSCQSLSENFIKEFRYKINFGAISRFQTLSEEFILENKGGLNWQYICKYQVLSEEFLKKFSIRTVVDWSLICQYQVLSEEFINQFLRKYTGVNPERLGVKSFNQTPEKCEMLRKKIEDCKLYEISGDYIFAYKALHTVEYNRELDCDLGIQFATYDGILANSRCRYNPGRFINFSGNFMYGGLGHFAFDINRIKLNAKNSPTRCDIVKIKIHINDVSEIDDEEDKILTVFKFEVKELI